MSLSIASGDTSSPYPRRWAAAVVLIGAFLLDLIDITIVNVALPAVQADLGASFTHLEWVSVAYLVAFAGGLFASARLGDHFGRRRVFLIAMIGFGVAAIGCGAAPTVEWLIAFRVLQGLTGAGVAPQVMSTLQVMFTGAERARVFGLFGLVAAGAQTLGMVIGGLIVTADVAGLGWRSVFLINVPLTVLFLIAAVRLVPETRGPRTALPRALSLALVAAALAAITIPLIEGHRLGWPVWSIASIVVAASVIGMVTVCESRLSHPERAVIPSAPFRSRGFRLAILVLVPVFSGYSGLLFVLPLWLQTWNGFSPLGTGLLTAAFSAGSVISALVVARLTARYGRGVVTFGCLTFAVGLGLFALAANIGAVVAALAAALAVMGLAFNLSIPALVTAYLSTTPPEHAGVASGIWNTAQQLAGALGVAVVGTVYLAGIGSAGHLQAITAGSATSAGLMLLAAVIALRIPRLRETTQPVRPAAERTP